MKRHCTPGFALLTLLLVFAAGARSQGFYVETVRSGSAEEPEKTYYMPKMFKTIDRQGSEISILRFDRETIYSIRPEKKTYTVVTFAEMKAMMDKVRAKSGDMMEKRLASLPPDQRQKIKERMGSMKLPGSAPAVRKVVVTGEHKTISGYSCDKYTVEKDGKAGETIWATKQVGGFESVTKDLRDFMERLSSVMGTKLSQDAWYKEVEGFPIQTESHGSVRTVTKVERRSIPASEFEVPAGYTREKDKMIERLDSDKN